MTWNLASDLVAILREQGKTDDEIIRKLEITTDRYKNHYKVGCNNNAHLKKQILDLRIKHKELFYVEVDNIWFDDWEKTYTYWKGNRYIYNGQYFEKDSRTTFDPYRAESIDWQFTVLIEPIYYQRPLETTGEIVGTLRGKQLVEIENVHGFNRGDKVYVRQEK